MADPEVGFGEATIQGTRIWATLLLALIADGASQQDLLAEYPSLTPADVDAAVEYGERVSRQRFEQVTA